MLLYHYYYNNCKNWNCFLRNTTWKLHDTTTSFTTIEKKSKKKTTTTASNRSWNLWSVFSFSFVQWHCFYITYCHEKRFISQWRHLFSSLFIYYSFCFFFIFKAKCWNPLEIFSIRRLNESSSRELFNDRTMKRRRSLRSTRTNSLWLNFWYNLLFYCWILSYLLVAISGEVDIGCPPSEAILPCRCSLRGKEIQIW